MQEIVEVVAVVLVVSGVFCNFLSVSIHIFFVCVTVCLVFIIVVIFFCRLVFCGYASLLSFMFVFL